jgi:small-conductance mechanosensitive channel
MSEKFVQSVQEWTVILGPAGRLLLIIAGAWLLRQLMRSLIVRLGARAILPEELVVALRRTASFVITAAALLLILEQLGVSATVLWTALTGFTAVAAVAFFAAWSVLSNIFCTILIVATRPFRLNDHVELLEGGDKPGLRGQVIDVNLIYTTLRESSADGAPGSVLQIPNNLFFQRTLRRWRATAAPAASGPARADSDRTPGADSGRP